MESMEDILKRITGRSAIAESVAYCKRLIVETYKEFIKQGLSEHDAYLLASGVIADLLSAETITTGVAYIMEESLDEYTGHEPAYTEVDDD